MTTSALEAVARLRRSTEAILGLVEGLSEAQWRLRPDGEEWSIAETVEHVVRADRAVGARLARILDAPIAVNATRVDDAQISLAMFRREGPAPALAVPTGCFATPAQGVAALGEAEAAIASWAAAIAGVDLRGYGAPHPIFGLFDAVQWILFAAVHSDSHAPQLRALRADPVVVAAR